MSWCRAECSGGEINLIWRLSSSLWVTSVSPNLYFHFDCCGLSFASFLGVLHLFESIWWLNTIAWVSMGKCRVNNCWLLDFGGVGVTLSPLTLHKVSKKFELVSPLLYSPWFGAMCWPSIVIWIDWSENFTRFQRDSEFSTVTELVICNPSMINDRVSRRMV